MRKTKVSSFSAKGRKGSSLQLSLRKKLTIGFILLGIPIYHQEAITLFNRPEPTKHNGVLCEHTVMHELTKLDVKHKDIVLAQSKLETGFYSSQLVRTHNNLFGFRTKKGYLRFDTWEESCEYYKKWQAKRYKKGDYYKFLVEIGYAEDPQYTTKLKKIIDDGD